MSLTQEILPETVEFVDYRQVDWRQVRRTQYWMYQCFRYEYPGPIRQLKQKLVVVPARQHGDQQLRDYQMTISVPSATIKQDLDAFGNPVFHCEIPEVESSVDFKVWTSVERGPQPGELPRLSKQEAVGFLQPTRLTTADNRITEIARQLTITSRTLPSLAEHINEWTFERMSYKSGVTNVSTTAAKALELGQGLCQDYSHIMLAVCREIGLPARYVSGHLLGEGGSHAWVEVLLPAPEGDGLVAEAFDPTNCCRAGLNYITIATGRDYSDVSPTSGSFIAPYSGHLTTSKRAGLTAVEYA